MLYFYRPKKNNHNRKNCLEKATCKSTIDKVTKVYRKFQNMFIYTFLKRLTCRPYFVELKYGQNNWRHRIIYGLSFKEYWKNHANNNPHCLNNHYTLTTTKCEYTAYPNNNKYLFDDAYKEITNLGR